ncbi:MAG TPA: diaminopimelate epimerase [Phenylobacterium sp.]|nr:diaminopimelate epimerase [Phenylobacterium sp.]
MSRPFLKMNGLGNDFVVVEARDQPFEPTAEEVRAIADRARGIGCDQLVSIAPSTRGFDAKVRFWNADGEEVGACGNGTRCVGWLIMQASGKDEAGMEGSGRRRTARRGGDHMGSVDMGEAGLGWQDIPLAEPMDTRGVELQVGPIDAPLLHTPGCVRMGNPHVVFFVDDIETAPVREVGPMIEPHRLFPEAVNVGFAQVKARDHIRLRVWERGAGLTKACGTGACAALVACARRGLTGRKARLELDGGDLTIEWREDDGHVIMTGPASIDFTGPLP